MRKGVYTLIITKTVVRNLLLQRGQARMILSNGDGM
jgi:hypothetical protein